MDGAMTDRLPPTTQRASFSPMPKVDMRHMVRMTDDTGMLQHGLFAVPDLNHGYCIDDNARALIAALLHAQLFGYDEDQVPLMRYLTFLTYAYNDKTQSFRNFMSYDRQWLEAVGSHDSQARTIWALGLTVKLAPHDAARDLAIHLIEKALPNMQRLAYIRSWAFLVIGLCEYLTTHDDEPAIEMRDARAHQLFEMYQQAATDDWPWWEHLVTYDNAKLSHALLRAGEAMDRPDFIDAGCRSLAWLLEQQTAPPGSPAPGSGADVNSNSGGGHLSIIGSNGWLTRDGRKAAFAQQPLEAYALVDACLAAARITEEKRWADHAWRCFGWFLGRNDLNVPLYNSQTGGCHDGLEHTGPNQNQGAESTLAYVLSTLELHLHHPTRHP